MDDLTQLAELIRAQNRVAGEIAGLIGRPAQIGHVGEYIAARIFGIRLAESASHKGSDGQFITGPLAGRSVNIKWTTKQDGLLNLTPQVLPDTYLVMAGPAEAPASSRGRHRPWVIHSVYLFETRRLAAALQALGVRAGVATSVRRAVWRDAEIYPIQRSRLLVLTGEQRRRLELFR